uniref:Secreted protein n=1 Tax=Phakopsora pachyrhizi TaxID=170000 RepID=A0A0S1MI75_PHAPC
MRSSSCILRLSSSTSLFVGGLSLLTPTVSNVHGLQAAKQFWHVPFSLKRHLTLCFRQASQALLERCLARLG